MSLFGAMGTAVSGLSAQSSAFSNISDNISNSQTVGYKRVDTGFEDYLTTSTAAINDPGSVVARPDYANNVQGSVTQTDNPLALAISGQGFFAVSEENGQNNGLPTFSAQQEYTRAGDFQMDKNGYLVNGSGAFLNGWEVDPTTGAVNRNTLAPIQINQAALSPVPTSSISLAANLPATPDAGTPVSSQVQVYDSLGTPHTVALNWTQVGPDHWSVAVNVPDDATSANRGTADVKFGPSSGNGVADGTIGSVTGGSGSVTASPYSANGAATLSFTTNFGTGTPQTIQINLGTYGQASGVTQYAGTSYSLRGLTQNGTPPGAFSSVSTKTNGDVVVNYDNGQSRTVARVPVITFNSPDALQRQDGAGFTATLDSGTPLAEDPGSTGAGNLVTSAVEQSNVDIASEFTKLIVAQRAYSANTKVVTTADDLMQQTIDMKR
ncbi:MAG: flagellar hook protein FlgE [Acetobacteraceae bacterium]|nr:flagellar hook protein FlgE [Acetobacteraceae bacterium]